jgi:hypothetical protein
MRKEWWYLLRGAIALMCLPSHCRQDSFRSRTIPAVSTDKPPVIDGKLDDEAWRECASCKRVY